MSSLANLEAKEGTVSGELTLTFSLPHRRYTITNDSTTKDLKFKFNNSEAFATLRPTETFNPHVHTNKIILSGSGVEYRVWGLG
jgi:hypothetical protein